MQVGIERCQGPGNQRNHLYVLQWPAQAGGGQGAGGGHRQHAHFSGGQLARQAGADAVEHRVAAGQHAHRLAAQGQNWGQRERSWPAQPLAGHAAWQQGQLARAAEDPRSAQQRAPGLLAQAAEAVFADTYNCQPGCHVFHSAIFGAAARPFAGSPAPTGTAQPLLAAVILWERACPRRRRRGP